MKLSDIELMEKKKFEEIEKSTSKLSSIPKNIIPENDIIDHENLGCYL